MSNLFEDIKSSSNLVTGHINPDGDALGSALAFKLILDSKGIDVYVDPKSLIYLDGTEMDYVKQGLNEGFEFKNPNQSGECGCGESFTV